MTLYEACKTYLDVMKGINRSIKNVATALVLIENQIGDCYTFETKEWCENYIATHEGSPILTESEIREKIKEYQEELDGYSFYPDKAKACELRYKIDLLKWVLKEDK